MVDVIRKRMSQIISFGQRYGIAIAIGLLVIFGGVFLINGRGEIADAIDLLGQVSPGWVVILAALQAVVIGIAAATYQFLLRRQGNRVRFLALAEIHLRRILVGAVTPVGGPASLYVFMRSLRPHGVSADDALLTASIRSVAAVVGFLMLLVPALLLQSHSTLIFTAATVLVTGLILILALGTWLLRARAVPVTMRRWMPARALQFIITAREHRITALDFILPAIGGAASHTTSAMMLYVGLKAVGYEATAGTVMIGYVIGKLFFMMAPFFQGIGIVEFGMALALQRAGVSPAVAVSGALLYRVGDLWIPLSWAFLIQIARARIASRLLGRGAKPSVEHARGARELPSRTWDAASQVFRMGQLVLIMAATFQLTSLGWVAVAAGLLIVA